MITRKFPFVLATAVAMAAMPQIAHASCKGDACNFVFFDGKNLTNKDPQLKIQVFGCFILETGTCGNLTFGYTIDPKASQPVYASSLGPDIKLDIRTAAFVGTRPTSGPTPATLGPYLLEKVAVTNSGQVPLKVVVLDSGLVDIGRTSDYKTGSFSIQLKKGVVKYHWQVFAPGAKEPCQQQRDETKSSISVQCQRPKAADKAAH